MQHSVFCFFFFFLFLVANFCTLPSVQAPYAPVVPICCSVCRQLFRALQRFLIDLAARPQSIFGPWPSALGARKVSIASWTSLLLPQLLAVCCAGSTFPRHPPCAWCSCLVFHEVWALNVAACCCRDSSSSAICFRRHALPGSTLLWISRIKLLDPFFQQPPQATMD